MKTRKQSQKQELGHHAQILDREKAVDYMLGGSAIFTVFSKKTGTRFTYSVRVFHAESSQPLFFAYVLTGANNEENYKFLGSLNIHGRWKPSLKSEIPEAATSSKTFAWLMNTAFRKNDQFEKIEFWHSGRCSRCHRLLTNPESIAVGLGPICRTKRDA